MFTDLESQAECGWRGKSQGEFIQDKNRCLTWKVTLDTKNLVCRKEQGPGNCVSVPGKKAGLYKFCVKCAFMQWGKGCEERMGCS